MNTFVIATEDGIKVEVKENLTKKIAEKMKKFFKEAKEFVSGIDQDIAISLQNRTIVLGVMLATVTSPEIISESCKILEGIMKKVNNFINDLPDEKEVTAPKDEKALNSKKVIDNAFESIKKGISNVGIFMMVANPEDGHVRIISNLKKNFVISAIDEWSK